MKRGLLIILSGPSGVGKGTVRAKLFANADLNLAYSISMTTRPIRPGEKDGVDYFFVDKENFLKALDNDELLEHAVFVGNYYGTPKKYVDDLRDKGYNVILEIEVEGAKQVIEKCPDAISFFLIPPTIEELENRIKNRKTETEEVIQKRLNKAKYEMKLLNIYTHVILNDSVDRAKDEITDILLRYIDK